MKIWIILLIAIYLQLSDQSFVWVDSEKKVEKAVVSPGSRFIVNIVEYKFVNNTEVKTPSKFRCIGTLVSENHVITTANCVNVSIGTHLGVQFQTLKETTNDIGYSLTFDNTAVIIHNQYNYKDNEMNNIALIKFNSLQISTNPPLYTIFKPRTLGSLPKIADYCTVIGRNVHLANQSNDTVFIIGPESCYGHNGRQAYCTIVENKDNDICDVIQGAPVMCKDGELSGFVLREQKSCIESNGKYQLRFHSIESFRGWIKYWMDGPETTTTAKPNLAGKIQMAFGVMLMILMRFIF